MQFCGSLNILWHCLSLGLEWKLTFSSPVATAVFQICWHIECSTFTASSFRIWNSSTGIPSPPLALFVVMLSKAHLTSHSRMSGSRWVITPSWLSWSWRSFLNSSSVYSCYLFLISSASVRRSVLGVLWKEWCWSWNSSTLATSCEELTHWTRLWCWEGLGAGGEGDDRGWDGWLASLTRWTWVWVNSGSWWWTGRPGVLRFMGSQRVGHDWATELNWTETHRPYNTKNEPLCKPWAWVRMCQCNKYIALVWAIGSWRDCVLRARDVKELCAFQFYCESKTALKNSLSFKK